MSRNIDRIEIIEGELYYKGKEWGETTESTKAHEQENIQEEDFLLTYSIDQVILFFIVLFTVVFYFTFKISKSYQSQIEKLEREKEDNLKKANQLWLNIYSKEKELLQKERNISQQRYFLQKQKKEIEDRIEELDYSNAIFLERIEELQRLQVKDPRTNMQQLVEFGKKHGEIVKSKENPRILKNQKELDDYIHSDKTTHEIGRDYELYISYLLRRRGYKVFERGVLLGYLDKGIDLVAGKDSKTLLIQCKCWASTKWVQIDRIMNLYGARDSYIAKNNLHQQFVKAVLITSSRASDEARDQAQIWNIEVIEKIPIGRFPRIKCKCGTYYLPRDQEYDKVEIFEENGDMWAETVAEAEAHGFIR